MQAVDALTVSVVVDNSSDMLSTRPAHIASELRVLISAGMGVLRTMERRVRLSHWFRRKCRLRFGTGVSCNEVGVWGATEQRKQLRSNLLSLSCLD